MSHPTLVQVRVGVERLPGAPPHFSGRSRVRAQGGPRHRDIHVNTATSLSHTRAPGVRTPAVCGDLRVSVKDLAHSAAMQIRSESTIAHPVDAVFEAYRDQLGEVAAYLDDIREIKVLSREEDGDVTRLHNEWASSTEIPAVAAKFLKPEHLLWDDYASWDAGARSCAWEIKTRAFTEAVTCRGGTRLVADGEVTRVILEGDLTVDTSAIKGIPRFLAGRITPQIEKFIVGLVTPNLEKTNAAIGRFLDDRRG